MLWLEVVHGVFQSYSWLKHFCICFIKTNTKYFQETRLFVLWKFKRLNLMHANFWAPRINYRPRFFSKQVSGFPSPNHAPSQYEIKCYTVSKVDGRWIPETFLSMLWVTRTELFLGPLKLGRCKSLLTWTKSAPPKSPAKTICLALGGIERNICFAASAWVRCDVSGSQDGRSWDKIFYRFTLLLYKNGLQQHSNPW